MSYKHLAALRPGQNPVSVAATPNQKIDRDAIEPGNVLKKELDDLRTEVDRVLGQLSRPLTAAEKLADSYLKVSFAN